MTPVAQNSVRAKQQGQWQVPPRTDDYANEVEIEKAEHDVTLRFYRRTESTGRTVKTITIPRSLFESEFGGKS